MRVRILAHERNTDNIRIGAAFYQHPRSLVEIAEDVRHQYNKRGADDLTKYHKKVAIVDADTLIVRHIIYSDPS